MAMTREIYFAGGCFWGTEHFFRKIDGVRDTVVGFANGRTPDPTYEEVYTDATGYAEAVRVCYDPAVVPLSFLLDGFFRMIDPLSLNRQGGDVGTRYRTGVYYVAEEDLPEIRAAFDRAGRRLGAAPVTECEPLRCFYPADGRHQKYLEVHPDGYCHVPLKAFRYVRLLQDLGYLLGDETDAVARQANAASLIRERMGFFWVGFYRVDGDSLVLGPFQGTPACQRIPFGKGVCGAAWARGETVVVPDVEQFPGHIACSSASRSEIVVPLLRDGAVTAVLDIDSTAIGEFDAIDAAWLEALVNII